MLQRWADYLDELRSGATVVPLRHRKADQARRSTVALQ
jgi:hypothetical protein